MKQAFNSYFILLKTCLRANYAKLSGKMKNDADATTETNDLKAKTGKALGAIGIGICLLLTVVSLIVMVATLTAGVIQSNMQKELLSVVLFAVQLLILFFGGIATLNYLYFSQDNQLLSSLPIKSSVVFAVKFTMAYLSELIISAIFTLPILLTFGITSAVLGSPVGAGFYILTILSVFLLPILPLLLISILSIPLMYIISYLKKRNVAKIIVSVILALVLVGVYFGFMMMSMGNGGEVPDGESDAVIINENLANMLRGGAKAGIMNSCLIKAMVGENAFVNFIIYFAGLVGIFAIAVILSSLFYRKGVSVLLEEGTGKKSKKKNKKATQTVAYSFRKSFLIKDIKTIIGTSQLLVSMIVGIIFAPLMVVFFNLTGMSGIEMEEGETFTLVNELFMVGLVVYIVTIMGGSTNAFAMNAFSLEEKNFAILKTMPISPKDVVLSKLINSNVSTVIMSVLAAIAYIATSHFHNVIIGLLILITLLVGGLGTSSLSLYYDLKNPKFNFGNINELTKNNKKAIKHTLINVGLGFVYFILGIVLAFIGLDAVAAYAIFFAVALLISGLEAFLFMKKLFDSADECFEKAEV